MKEPGIYHGALVEMGTDKLNNEKETPYIYLKFEISGKLDVDGNVDEGEIFDRDVKMFLSEKALPYTEKNLKSLGFNGDYENPRVRDNLYEEGCKLCCEENGEYENWSIDMLGGTREHKPLDKASLKKLSAQFKKHQGDKFSESPKTNAEAKKQHEETVANGVDEADDIPF